MICLIGPVNHVRALRVENPRAQGVGKDKPDCYGCIVERLRTDRVELWEEKHDRDKGNPEHGGDRDWVRELAEMKWASHESICTYDAQGDRNSYLTRISTVKNVEPNRGWGWRSWQRKSAPN